MVGRIRTLDGRIATALLLFTAAVPGRAEEPTPLPEPSSAIEGLDWQALPTASPVRPGAQARPLPFQDRGGVSGLFNLRQISLLTLAESPNSRWFLGINREGILGVHFGATSRHTPDQTVELMRLPHLRPVTNDVD